MLVLSSLICSLALAAFTDAQITMGTAGQYGVFAASTITNTGLTVVNGKIGLSPGTSITGFPAGIASAQDIDNTAATTAQGDIAVAYAALASMTATEDLTGEDLGGLTLDSGVYNFDSSGFLTGTLTLDAQGDADALFIFQFGSTLITASNANIILINGAQPCNVYWQVGSSATLGTNTAFLGNILAQASITATTGVSVNGGGLYAITAAVTLDTNAINPEGGCGGVIVFSTTSTATSTILPTSSLTAATVDNPTTTPTTLSGTTTSIVITLSTTIISTISGASTTSIPSNIGSITSTGVSVSDSVTSEVGSVTSTLASVDKSTTSDSVSVKSTTTHTKTAIPGCAGHTMTYNANYASTW